MAASPSFIGTPRTQVTAFDSVTYDLVTVFTAGALGCVVKSFDIYCVADQQLYAMVQLIAGGVAYAQGLLTLNVTSTADAALDNYGPVTQVLIPSLFPHLVTDPVYLELGADEFVKVTIHDGAGGGPAAGETARTRVVGADY